MPWITQEMWDSVKERIYDLEQQGKIPCGEGEHTNFQNAFEGLMRHMNLRLEHIKAKPAHFKLVERYPSLPMPPMTTDAATAAQVEATLGLKRRKKRKKRKAK